MFTKILKGILTVILTILLIVGILIGLVAIVVGIVCGISLLSTIPIGVIILNIIGYGLFIITGLVSILFIGVYAYTVIDSWFSKKCRKV